MWPFKQQTYKAELLDAIAIISHLFALLRDSKDPAIQNEILGLAFDVERFSKPLLGSVEAYQSNYARYVAECRKRWSN